MGPGGGIDSYLYWFYETAIILRELLSNNGSIYIHMDAHMAPYGRIIMNEIFQINSFRNEIYWYYTNKIPDTRKRLFTKSTDTILFYAGNENYFKNLEEKRDIPIKVSKMKKVNGKKIYIKGDDGKVEMMERNTRVIDNVWKLAMLHAQPEITGYATQKPEQLLERIINASSKENDLILDCFVGSGTTAIVSEKLNRRWITCDLSRFSIHTTRKRLLGISNIRPFIIQNLGKYERQAWQVAEFSGSTKDQLQKKQESEAAYRKFILELYHAQPVHGNVWLHGIKNGRMVHVGAVDAPVTESDVKAVAREVWKSVSNGKDELKAAADILGWDFQFELNEMGKQIAAAARVDVRFKKIPREVLEKQAVDQGDIQFFELAALSVETQIKGQELNVKLTDFVIPSDDVPEEARKAIKHWSQMIDYWAIDWDFRNDTFHNQWQRYRTRKDPGLELHTSHQYTESGNYIVMVKVVDILGNDTTKALSIEISKAKSRGA